MSRCLTTEEFIKKAKSIHGDKFDYVNSTYINAKTKIEIKCKKHSNIFFQNSNNHFLSKFPCKECNLENKRLLFSSNIEEFKTYMIKKYGNTLSFEKAIYKNARTDIILVCKKHKLELKKAPYEFKISTCHMCSKENIDDVRSSKQIKLINEYVSSFGGKLISKKYVNNETDLKFKCKKGHVFFESWSDVKNSMRWCKECVPNRHIGETLTRMILEYLINCKLPSSYLKSMDGLQLDGYCKERKIAFEYQGYQHFSEVNHYHYSKNQFKAQIKRDSFKKELCKKNRITLIEIFEFKTIRKGRIEIFVNQVKKELDKLKINYTSKPFIPDLIRLYRGKESSLYISAKEIINNLDGEIQEYIGSNSKHSIICSKGHKAFRLLSVIKRNGYQCSVCQSDLKFNLINLKIESRGGILISRKLKKNQFSTMYSWICDKGHENKTKGQYLKDGTWCGTCQIENQTKDISKEKLTQIASNNTLSSKEKFDSLGVSMSLYYKLLKKHGIINQVKLQDRSSQDISKKAKGRLYQINTDTLEIIKTYPYLEAIKKDKSNSFSPENIRGCFKRNSKAYGYYWCREENYDLLIEKLKK